MSKKKVTKAKAKPAAKAKKPVAKKVAKPAKKVAKAKPAPKAKKAAPKKVAKPAKKVAKAKPAPKKAVAKKPVAKKTVKAASKAKPAKVVAKPVKVVAKPAPVAPVKAKKVAEVKPVRPAEKNPVLPPMPPPVKPAISKSPLAPTAKITHEDPNKTRYSDKELDEFRVLITGKLEDARRELTLLQAQLNSANEHGTDDTANTFKMLEDGSESLAKEEAGQLAGRQKKFIEQLENALVRIENKTYGICRVTSKLIPKERLRAVPHTTQSIEAKINQYRD
jgi:RNA polymerase-binding transcription factor DksA